jgi:hypothetical protein
MKINEGKTLQEGAKCEQRPGVGCAGCLRVVHESRGLCRRMKEEEPAILPSIHPSNLFIQSLNKYKLNTHWVPGTLSLELAYHVLEPLQTMAVTGARKEEPEKSLVREELAGPGHCVMFTKSLYTLHL